MTSRALLALIAFTLCASAKAQSWGDKLQGLYLTVDGGGQVSVYKEADGTFSGKLVWLREDKARLDTKNPDKARQSDRLWGLVILHGFTPNDATKRWEGGKIYDPKNGKTYDGFIYFDPEEPGVLRLKGYVLGIKWLGRETHWTLEKTLRN